jgi:hypothetical protein
MLRLYRPVAHEVVCAVNARFSREELAVLDGIVDRVVPCEIRPDFSMEHYFSWLLDQCNGDWIYLTASDEVPAGQFLDRLPTLVAADDVVSYMTRRYWLYPDAQHWIEEYPWNPDWQCLLVRNDPATLHVSGAYHGGTLVVEPYRIVDTGVYHLDCVMNSFEARQAKVRFYEDRGGDQRLEDGRSINDVYYLPERHVRTSPVPIPAADVPNVTAVLEAGATERIIGRDDVPSSNEDLLPGFVPYEEIVASWTEAAFPESAYKATVQWMHVGRTPNSDLSTFVAGEHRDTTVAVRNHGTRTWARAWRGPGAGLALAERWRRLGPGDQPVNGDWIDGAPVAFTASVPPGTETIQRLILRAPDLPGRYELVVDVVHLNVRWFGGGATQVVDVLR